MSATTDQLARAQHREEAERLLSSAKRDELELQGCRREQPVSLNYHAETVSRERELDVLLKMATVHALLGGAS